MEVFDAILAFAKDIGMIALPIDKEQPSYILNLLLVSFLDAAENLLVNDVPIVETIDKTWIATTGLWTIWYP